MTATPSATINTRRRMLAAIILAVIVAQPAFAAVGNAEVSAAAIDTGAELTATAVSDTPAKLGPTVASTASVDGAMDASNEAASSEEAQVVWDLYIHPFWDDLCFWACWEIVCPCQWIFWP